MEHIYAQLNEDNVCVGVSQLSGEVIAPNMIPLTDANTDVLSKKYVDGEWLELPAEPEPVMPISHTATDVMQFMNDLKADLIISGVI